MKKVVLSLAAIISTGSVFAECGEHYPENQGHGCFYAYRFGKSKEPGPRERVFEFKETRSLGTVLFAFGNHLTVAAQGADGAWTPLKRIDADGERATSEPFWEKESKYSVWYAPKGFAAKAVKAVVDIPASESPAADGFYEAAVGGLLTWSNKWVNVAPLATPFASSNPRDAKIVTNGRVNSWGEWTSESNGRVISPENPQPVRSRGLRVKIVKPMNSKKEHPHTCKRSKEGEVAVLRELVALASYASARPSRRPRRPRSASRSRSTCRSTGSPRSSSRTRTGSACATSSAPSRLRRGRTRCFGTGRTISTEMRTPHGTDFTAFRTVPSRRASIVCADSRTSR